ncbi:hypothetical protein MY11210_002308 [Beauveria gryllotalpidicola]
MPKLGNPDDGSPLQPGNPCGLQPTMQPSEAQGCNESKGPTRAHRM